MEKSPDDREDRDRYRHPHFSCAFCKTDSEKPFKICESCGKPQPEREAEEE